MGLLHAVIAALLGSDESSDTKDQLSFKLEVTQAALDRVCVERNSLWDENDELTEQLANYLTTLREVDEKLHAAQKERDLWRSRAESYHEQLKGR